MPKLKSLKNSTKLRTIWTFQAPNTISLKKYSNEFENMNQFYWKCLLTSIIIIFHQNLFNTRKISIKSAENFSLSESNQTEQNFETINWRSLLQVYQNKNL